MVSIRSCRVGESSWPQVTLLSDTHVPRARDGVADGLPTHSGSRDPATAILNSKTVSTANSQIRRVEAHQKGESSSADTAASSSYFSRVKRPRPWAILLILDDAAVHLRVSSDSRIFCLAGGRLHFCRLFTSHALRFGSFSLFFLLT